MSYYDIKSREVDDRLQLMLLFATLFNTTELKIQICVALYIGFCCIYKYISKYIGGADIKLLLILMLLPINILTVTLISSISALIYSLLKSRKSVAFVPFITLGYIGSLIVKI